MGQPAAKQGDQVTGTDIHNTVPAPVFAPLPFPFTGILQTSLSPNVNIMKLPAATVGSGAINLPPHPAPVIATNTGTVLVGSATVFINKKPAARNGDLVLTCNDPVPLPTGTIVASGTVFIG